MLVNIGLVAMRAWWQKGQKSYIVASGAWRNHREVTKHHLFGWRNVGGAFFF